MVKDIPCCKLNYRLFQKFKLLENDEFNYLAIILTLHLTIVGLNFQELNSGSPILILC